MNSHWKRRGSLSALIALWVGCFAGITQASEEQGKIRGLIYISPSGKLEGDLVMRAREVNVMLLERTDVFEGRLRATRESRITAIDKQRKTVAAAEREYGRFVDKSRAEREEKFARLIRERQRLVEILAAFQREVEELIAKNALVKTKTDSDGKFEFAAVSPGRYLIHSHFEIRGMEVHYYWLLPVDLEKGEATEVSLTKLNSVTLFY